MLECQGLKHLFPLKCQGKDVVPIPKLRIYHLVITLIIETITGTHRIGNDAKNWLFRYAKKQTKTNKCHLYQKTNDYEKTITFNGIRTIVSKSGVTGYSLSLGSIFGDKVINLNLGSAFAQLTTPANTLLLGQWQHIAATFNDVTNASAIYLNGNIVASGTYTGTYSGSTNDLAIGASNNGSANLFKGSLDVVRIWDVTRSQAEIQTGMEATIAGTESGLVAYYPFEEGSGTLVTDVANVYNGTTQNMSDLNWTTRSIITLIVDVCAGIESNPADLNISMYPNPTKGKLDITIVEIHTETTLSIMDVSGKTILDEKISTESNHTQVDFSNLPKGVYAVKVISGNVVKVSRLVVQ